MSAGLRTASKVLLPHTLADGNYCIQIMEKRMLKFSSMVLPTPFLYVKADQNRKLKISSSEPKFMVS